jgi:predicted nucleic acid-binding protein
VIFLDSNIPMYLIGAAHSKKAESQILLERTIAAGERLVTDAEVLQEILHRYTAIDRRDAIAPALRLTLDIVDEVFAIEKADVLRASEITQNRAQLSARDSVHLAVMERHGIRSILSFDSDFDRWPGIRRVHEV